ncbi:hypothetical protein [Rubinisphaera margarita]|uniref:hypothetical protein n=1 Tax=Rubinisphaera margarita TaxID=2909586 RepID=UPI001EE8E5AE|nr:hypothetical protein [Rubinisphaera margarita]MCG6155480.1 hypothetical protein [Rubinisphaera margarita]
MTSQSHKKHPTTPPSIRPARRIDGRLVALGVILVTLTLWLTAGSRAAESPLDRLRGRSAETRWKSLRERAADRREYREERRERRRNDKGEEIGDDGQPLNPSPDSPLPTPTPPDIAGLPTPTPPDWTPAPPRAPMRLEIESGRRPVPTPTGPIELYDPAPPSSAPPARPLFQNHPELMPVPSVPAAPKDAPIPAPPVTNGSGKVDDDNVAIYEEMFQFEQKDEQTIASKQVSADRASAEELPPQTVTARKAVITRSVGTPSVTKDSTQPQLLIELPMPIEPQYSTVSTLQTPEIEATEKEIENSPFLDERIKPLSDISPYVTYEPDASLREVDPTRHFCPRAEFAHLMPSSSNSKCPEISELPGDEVSHTRQFAHLQYCWAASNINYYPLYFEDPQLERYGHMHHPLLQPFVSVSRFNWQFLGLPYQMCLKPVAKCVYPLGYFRPGDCEAPKLYHQVPISLKAAFVTAEVYTGLFFIFP